MKDDLNGMAVPALVGRRSANVLAASLSRPAAEHGNVADVANVADRHLYDGRDRLR